MRPIVRDLLNWILPFFLFRLAQIECKGLIEKVTSQGDLDLVLLFDVGFKENKEKNRSKALDNIAELAKNLLVEGERKVNLTYVTYDSVGVQTVARADNRGAENRWADNRQADDRSAKRNVASADRRNGSLEKFTKAVMKTEMLQSQQSSNHLKALNYVGIKHFYAAKDTSTKMVIMFMNTEGIPARDDTELNIVHYLLDRKNITLNIITKVNLKSYCHYLHKVGPNTNELLRCVLKNSYYHKLILTYTLEKFYDDIAKNATCSEWSEWSDCTVTCNVGYHFSKRNTLHNVENALGGKYKRTGKNCTDQRSLVIQECFEKSCNHSLDVCDIEIDLSLLVDDSSRISQDFWLKYILKPIRNLIAHLNLSSNLVNISITTFSQETYNWVDFSSNLSRNRDDLLLFLEYWRFNFGGTSNDLRSALNYMHNHVLNSNEGRPNAHKVLVIFNTGDVSNKATRGTEDIIRNIKLIYGADVYAICLNNSREGNCEAISGAGVGTDEVVAAGGANQGESANSDEADAPFFYSYSNVSDFREQLPDIQRNICKNAHQAIVASRRRRRKNLRRADDDGKPSRWHGRRRAPREEGEEGEEVAKGAGKRAGKGTREEEGDEAEEVEEVEEEEDEEVDAEEAIEEEADADGGAELETKSIVEPGADAESESVKESPADPPVEPLADPSVDPPVDPQTGQKADQRVYPDVVAESLPRRGLDEVPREPPNEMEKMAQKLHGEKTTNKIPPYYPSNGGNLKGLNKNRVILKSFTNLERIDDAEEEEEVDVEPTQNPLKKYSSEYNIDALPSYKNKGKKNLICRLLKFLLRKKKKYRLQKFDPKDREKIKQFIADVNDLSDSEEIYHQRERQIEEDFNVMLESIFKNGGSSPFSDLDFDSASVSSYGSYLEDEEELGLGLGLGLELENTLPCSWFYIDAAQMNVDQLEKGRGGADVGGLADADTVAGSRVDMDNDSDKDANNDSDKDANKDSDNDSDNDSGNHSDGEATPEETGKSIQGDVCIADILVKEGGFATSERRKLNRRKRSIDQAQGQTTSNEENNSANNNGPDGSAESKGGEPLLPGSHDEDKKGEYKKTEAGHGGKDGRVPSSPPTSSTQPLSPDGSRPPRQKKFKSKFDIIQRFKNMAAVADDKTGVSFDSQKYPSPESNEGKKRTTNLEEHTEEKKDDPSAHIPNSFQRTKCSKESTKPCDQGGVVPPPSPMNNKKAKENEATIGERINSKGHVKVDENPGMIKDKKKRTSGGTKNETSGGTKNETHAHDPNEQVQYDLLQQNHSSSEWDTGHYDPIHEEEYADSSIYKYSASFALIAVVLLGAAFLYIRKQKSLMEHVPVASNDFVTHKGGKNLECREQHIVLKPDETSWQ